MGADVYRGIEESTGSEIDEANGYGAGIHHRSCREAIGKLGPTRFTLRALHVHMREALWTAVAAATAFRLRCIRQRRRGRRMKTVAAATALQSGFARN